MKDRAIRVFKNTLVALSLLIIVGVGVLTGYRVPCAFKTITGLDCPGCGMTRAVILIFQGKILQAIQMNPFVSILPIIGIFAIIESIKYIKFGTIDKCIQYIIIGLAILLTVYGIVRNI